jgi:hypothetical protein
MTQGIRIVTLAALLAFVPALGARAQSDSGTINIMTPEKGTRGDFKAWGVPLPKPVRRAHGSSSPVYPSRLPPPLHYVPPRSLDVTRAPPNVPPPIIAPRTGIALPNLPSIGNGPGGTETGQDRAIRCAHQTGVYGQAGTGYLGTCINQ